MKKLFHFLIGSKRYRALKLSVLILCFLFLSVWGIPQVNEWAYQQFLKQFLDDSIPVTSVVEGAGNQQALFLDAREKEEFEVSHIPKASWVGYDDFELSRLDTVPKEQPLIVYCSIGLRSEKIAKRLMEAGFENVQNLYGGIFQWVNQGYEVENSQGETTEQVHGYSRMWGIFLRKGTKVYK